MSTLPELGSGTLAHELAVAARVVAPVTSPIVPPVQVSVLAELAGKPWSGVTVAPLVGNVQPASVTGAP